MPDLDRDFLLNTASELVSINSVNPCLVPSSPGEREIADCVVRTLQERGLKTQVVETHAGRPSVLAQVDGERPGPSLMFNAHYDTVGVEGMEEPFGAKVVDGKLYGRGAYDMKGALAACMAALVTLASAEHRAQMRGSVVLAAVADEEHSSLGTVDVLEVVDVDGAIVTEPTELEVCLAHKGFVWYEIVTQGKAAHGSRPDLGVDANLLMRHFLEAFSHLDASLKRRLGHPLLGAPSLHAARIEGGSGWSTYSSRCSLQIERRTLPGEDLSQVEAEVQTILGKLRHQMPELEATYRLHLWRAPFEASRESRLVDGVSQAVQKVLGQQAVYSGQGPWMDAGLLQEAGVDTVVIGPKGSGAHAEEEWVEIQSLLDLSKILVETANAYLGQQRTIEP